MRVKLKVLCEDPLDVFQELVEILRYAKKKDDWDLARLDGTATSATYTTCCRNVWSVELSDGDVFFEYKGTRAGFLKAQPFSGRLTIHTLHDGGVELEVLRSTTTVDDFQIVNSKFYITEVVEYETSTPKEWDVRPADVIIPLREEPDKAVVMRGETPLKVVPYRNVYKP